MFHVEHSIQEGETLGLSGISSLLCPGRSRSEGQYLWMGLERKVKDRSWKSSWAKLRKEKHLELQEKQPKG